MYIKEDRNTYLKLNASEIGSLIGVNKYISKDTMLIKLWLRNDKESFEGSIERNNIKKINIIDLKENYKVKNQLKSYINNIKNIENGTINEPKIIELYQSIKNVSIKDNNKTKYSLFINNNYEKLLYHKLVINGLIDGIVVNEDDKYIVEIKDRQNKIFNEIPEHEMVQIMIYMKMTNINKCHHIQKCNKEMKSEIIYFDNNKWNEIEKEIVNFLDYFEKIYFNEIFQDLYIKKILKNTKIKNEISANIGLVLEIKK